MPQTPDSPGLDDIPCLDSSATPRFAYAVGVRRAIRGRLRRSFRAIVPYVLGGIVNGGGSAADLVRQLGISKQAASRLVDVLVENGYLERAKDPTTAGA